MPPVTPRATFMVVEPPQSLGNALSVVTESLIHNFGGLLSGAARFRDFPFHLAGADFILRDAAGFAGICLYHRRSARMQLPGALGGDQNVAIVAVKAFNQFHGLFPPCDRDANLDCRKLVRLVVCQRKLRTPLLFSHETQGCGGSRSPIWLPTSTLHRDRGAA